MSADGNEDWIELARARMAAKGKVKPSTKAGAVRALWPAIEIALNNGQTLKNVRDWLEDEGVPLTYNQLTSYVGRIRRRMKRIETAQPRAGEIEVASNPTTGNTQPRMAPSTAKPQGSVQRDADPLANVRARERTRPTFEYNPDFKEDELI